jgi:hypothetical protein
MSSTVIFKKHFTQFATSIFHSMDEKVVTKANFIRYFFEDDGEAEVVIKKEVGDICPTTFETLDWLLSIRHTTEATMVDRSLKLRAGENNWNVWVYIKDSEEFPFERHYFLNIQEIN